MRFEEPCGPQPRPSGGPLFAFAHSRGLSAGRGPNIDVLFVKQALRLRAVRRRPTAADCNSPEGSRSPPPSANSKPAGRRITKNTSNNKKSTQIVVRYNYLYYFWGKRSVEKDVNRIAVLVNVRNLLSNSNQEDVLLRIVNHAPNGSGTSNDCAMTGVGLLYYEVRQVSHDRPEHSNASALYSAGLSS